ncbi:MAG: HD domain-containing protein [Caldilineaceae bacterium]|nr:HD domain-containing protein [Caldilineaceae bacterium]
MPEFEAILAALLQERSPVYVVGGAVRDHLLGRDAGVTDLDLALAGPVLPAARQVADKLGWAYYPLDEERDVARLVLQRETAPPLICDLACLRGDLASDLALRDFTINALALEMARDRAPRLIDQCGGRDDLAAGRIRTVGAESLAADPVRMLRAVRFAGQLGFAIDAETEARILGGAQDVRQASAERLRDELWKIMGLPAPGDALVDLHRLGLLVYVLPEVAAMDQIHQSPPHHLDVLGHTVQVMNYAANLRDWLTDPQKGLPDADLEAALVPLHDRLAAHFSAELSAGHSRGEWLVWHALFHDTGKPSAYAEEVDETGTRRIRFFGHENASAAIASERGEFLRFSRREVQIAQKVAANHMRPHHLADSFPDGEISRRACYRFLRDTATGGREDRTGLDVLFLALADRQAPGKTRGGGWGEYLKGMIGIIEYAFAPNPVAGNTLVDGNQLMHSLDLPAGRMVGYLLESIAEAQAAGEVATESDALALAAELIRRGDFVPADNAG